MGVSSQSMNADNLSPFDDFCRTKHLEQRLKIQTLERHGLLDIEPALHKYHLRTF